jgi:hypothetical protein
MGLPLPSGILFLSAIEYGSLYKQQKKWKSCTQNTLRVHSYDLLPACHPDPSEQQKDNGSQRETLKNSKNPKYFRVHFGSPYHLLMIPGKGEKIQHSTFRIQHFFHASMHFLCSLVFYCGPSSAVSGQYHAFMHFSS